EKFDAKKAEIEALDQQYEQERTARANARAMRDQLADLSGRQVGGDIPVDGDVVDRTGDRVLTRWGVPASAERGAALKAKNAVQLASEGILVPTRYSGELSPAFNEVSSLLDRV